MQIKHLRGTLVHGVDDVLFDAAFKPKAESKANYDTFLRVPIRRESTGAMFLRCSFPGLGSTTHVLAFPSSFPEPSPKLCRQQQIHDLRAIRSLSEDEF